MKRFLSGALSLVLVLFLAAAAYGLVFERQAIIDWWRHGQYKPTPQVMALADSGSFTDHARWLFYASQPAIQSRELFNQSCRDHGEESVVLGCYSAQNIYIFDITDPRLAGVKEVTAAHEMLHAVYERLRGAEKENLNTLLQTEIQAKAGDEHLKNLTNLYNQHEPGELLNEMHSILGTEYRNLAPGLESYYARFFADRQKVVGFAEGYETVFTQSKSRIAALDAQLDALKIQIDSNNAELERRQDDLHAQNADLQRLQQEDPGAYNQRVPGYNSLVTAFNNLAAQTRALVSQFNALVNERNAEAAAQNNLHQSLDSNHVPSVE